MKNVHIALIADSHVSVETIHPNQQRNHAEGQEAAHRDSLWHVESLLRHSSPYVHIGKVHDRNHPHRLVQWKIVSPDDRV